MLRYFKSCFFEQQQPTAQQVLTTFSQATLDAATTVFCAAEYMKDTNNSESMDSLQNYAAFTALGSGAFHLLSLSLIAILRTFCPDHKLAIKIKTKTYIQSMFDIVKNTTALMAYATFMLIKFSNPTTETNAKDDRTSSVMDLFMLLNIAPNALNLLKSLFLSLHVCKRQCSAEISFNEPENLAHEKILHNFTAELPSSLGSIAGVCGGILFATGNKIAGALATTIGHGAKALCGYGLFTHRTSQACCAKTCGCGDEEERRNITERSPLCDSLN